MRRNDRRWARQWRLAVTMLLWLPGAALAQAQPSAVWPPKLVRIIVPFGPGSSPDIVGRLLADSLQ
ncbi:MAG: hypothetical protein JWR89_1595, partial [Tardiphaga sp.]|nr:hypothetical protein [Tardiphaga sp.]